MVWPEGRGFVEFYFSYPRNLNRGISSFEIYSLHSGHTHVLTLFQSVSSPIYLVSVFDQSHSISLPSIVLIFNPFRDKDLSVINYKARCTTVYCYQFPIYMYYITKHNDTVACVYVCGARHAFRYLWYVGRVRVRACDNGTIVIVRGASHDFVADGGRRRGGSVVLTLCNYVNVHWIERPIDRYSQQSFDKNEYGLTSVTKPSTYARIGQSIRWFYF